MTISCDEQLIKKKDVKIVELAALDREEGALFQEFLARGDACDFGHELDAVLALHGSYVNGGYLLRIMPKSGTLATPLTIRHEVPAVGKGALPHQMIFVARGAKAVVVQEYCAQASKSSQAEEKAERFFFSVTDIVVSAGASLHYLELQKWPESVQHLGRVRIWLERDASFYGFQSSLGAKVARTDMSALLTANSSCDLLGST